jgi:hypothetical protein
LLVRCRVIQLFSSSMVASLPRASDEVCYATLPWLTNRHGDNRKARQVWPFVVGAKKSGLLEGELGGKATDSWHNLELLGLCFARGFTAANEQENTNTSAEAREAVAADGEDVKELALLDEVVELVEGDRLIL